MLPQWAGRPHPTDTSRTIQEVVVHPAGPPQTQKETHEVGSGRWEDGQMTKILVPLDGSYARDRAIRWADTLAGVIHADLTLLRTLSESDSGEAAMRALRQVRQGLRRPAAVTTQIARGAPADAIAGEARGGYELVIMGSRVEQGVPRDAPGATLNEVIEQAGIPVLIVGPGAAQRPPRRIVVPLDGSEIAAAILPFVGSLARQLHCMVMLVGVHSTDLSRASSFRDTSNYLHQAGAELSRQGVPARTVVREGKPGPTILEFAQAASADLIAMSTGRLRGERRQFGEVAEYVLANASVPVLAIHPLAVERSMDERPTAHQPKGMSMPANAALTGRAA